ncbi:MAG: PAS domain S-box protein [Leptothrix sp. (in: b-proteobacteria)]
MDPVQPDAFSPLASSPWLLNQIIQQSPVGIAVIDRSGAYVTFNPAYAAIYGYGVDELRGLPFTVLFSPHKREMVFALHQRFIDDGTVQMNREWQVMRRDGSVLTVLASSMQVPAEDGRLHRLVFVADLSARKRAEQVQRDSEALLRDLTASIPGVLFRLTRSDGEHWRMSYVSPGIEALFELSAQQMLSDPLAGVACIVEEDRAAQAASLKAALQGNLPWSHEYRIRTASGVQKWIHSHAEPKTTDRGERVWTGMLTDVSARKQIEAALKRSEETYRTLFETVPQGVVCHDTSGRIVSANSAAQRILGLTLDQLQGLTPIDPRWRAVREDGSEFPGDEHPAMRALRSGESVKDVVMGVAVPDRGQVWILVNATPLWRQGHLDEVYTTFEDITERVLLAQELRRQASTDALTGVANRRSLIERLASEFDRVARHPEHRCSVLALDLDHFKAINDRWGHAAGDAVLCHVTTLMTQATRRIDLVGRSGGEEFMLLLPDTGADEARALADRLCAAIAAAPLAWGEPPTPIDVTVSIGVSVIDARDSRADAVLARADAALYQAKAAGRNTVCQQLAPR